MVFFGPALRFILENSLDCAFSCFIGLEALIDNTYLGNSYSYGDYVGMALAIVFPMVTIFVAMAFPIMLFKNKGHLHSKSF